MNEKHPSSPLVRALNSLMKEVGGSEAAGAEEPSVEMREENEDGNVDESRAPRVARRPYTPSKAEVEAHYPCTLNTAHGVRTAEPVGAYLRSTDIARMWTSRTWA